MYLAHYTKRFIPEFDAECRIGKYCKNGSLRSQLITGAMSVVIKVIKYGAKTKKELWLQGLMQRRGNRCAAVALANKTVRTAYSMLQNNTEYHAA